MLLLVLELMSLYTYLVIITFGGKIFALQRGDMSLIVVLLYRILIILDNMIFSILNIKYILVMYPARRGHSQKNI